MNVLIEFSVKNFLSFKEKMTFSMVAGASEELQENLIETNELKEKVFKTCAIFGANGSGKSNLLRALSTAIFIVRTSNFKQINDKLTLIQPFAFDEKTKNEPSEFEFVLYTNSKKYIYGFSADKDRIHKEYLYEYTSAKPTRIFERVEDNYKYFQKDERKLKDIEGKNLPNKLFLATTTIWNYDKACDVYNWFENQIDIYDSSIFLPASIAQRFSEDFNGDQRLKSFTLKLLKFADIDIKDYKVRMEEVYVNSNVISVMKMLDIQIPTTPPKEKRVIVDFVHEIVEKNGRTRDYELNFSMESAGTRAIFIMSYLLMEALKKGKTIFIDEMERSLNPEIVKLIISFFIKKENNPNNAQLIFVSRNTQILSNNLLRRDQVWIAEKNNNEKYTEIYPIDKLGSPRKGENLERSMRQGKYGGNPKITKDGFLWGIK